MGHESAEFLRQRPVSTDTHSLEPPFELGGVKNSLFGGRARLSSRSQVSSVEAYISMLDALSWVRCSLAAQDRIDLRSDS